MGDCPRAPSQEGGGGLKGEGCPCRPPGCLPAPQPPDSSCSFPGARPPTPTSKGGAAPKAPRVPSLNGSSEKAAEQWAGSYPG